MALFDAFEAPHNLPVVEYAKMAGKSRRWICYEIQADNLLALQVGNRGQRVPAWHLNPIKHSLIQVILKLIRDAAPWQIYHARLKPHTALHGRSALDAVTDDNLEKISMTVSMAVMEEEWSMPQLHIAPSTSSVVFTNGRRYRAPFGRIMLAAGTP